MTAGVEKRGKIEAVSKREIRANALVRKIQSLPPEKVAEVEDFVEFLSQREDHRDARFAAPGCNPADAAYDRL